MQTNTATLNELSYPRIKKSICYLLKNVWNEACVLSKERREIQSVDKIAEIDTALSSLVNEVNSLYINKRKVNASQLGLGKAGSLETYAAMQQISEYNSLAENYLLEGKYVPQFLFAGAATRFGLGAMWSVNLAVLGDVLLGRTAQARRYLSSTHIKDIQNRLDILSAADVRKAQIKLRSLRKKTNPVYIGMGPRQLIQYRIKLEQLAHKYGTDPCDVLNKTRMVIHLNTEVFSEVTRDLTGNNFYGFNPDNIYILIQPTYKAMCLRNGHLVKSSASTPLPYGHGHATMQMLYKKEAFKLDRHGKKKILQRSVIDDLLENKCLCLGSHRINDMKKWTADVINIRKLAFALYHIRRKKKEAVIELVKNPHNQKGGYWLRAFGKEFLAETLRISGSNTKDYFESISNVPYNAFRNIYDLQAFKRKLTRSKGIKLNLRYTDGGFYLESVTGDLTLIMNSVAFREKNEVIHDIKNMADYVHEGIDFIARQERNPRFVQLANECK